MIKSDQGKAVDVLFSSQACAECLKEQMQNMEAQSTARKRECVTKAQGLHSAWTDLLLFYVK